MPAEDETQATRPADPERKRAAIVLLDQMHVAVGTEALRSAARDAQPQVVAALLDAAWLPTPARRSEPDALYFATFIGCSSQRPRQTDWLVETVRQLVDAGADLQRKDDNGNTALMSAAQMCGPRIVEVLVAGGAEVNYRNGSGVSPLGMALIMKKLDAADVLVAKGARLTAQEAGMLRGSATECGPRP